MCSSDLTGVIPTDLHASNNLLFFIPNESSCKNNCNYFNLDSSVLIQSPALNSLMLGARPFCHKIFAKNMAPIKATVKGH